MQVETIPVWRGKGPNEAEIRVAQLPNGKWVGGHSLWLTNGGAGSSPHPTDTPFATRQDAIADRAKWLKSYAERTAATTNEKPPQALIAALNEFATPAKLTLF